MTTNTYKAKETVLVITVGLLVLYLVFKGEGWLYAAVAVGGIGVLSGYLAGKIDWIWGKLSLLLSAVSNRILLGIVFLLVVTPMGVIRRMRKKDGMVRVDPEATSNFTERDKVFEKEDLENTW